MSTYSLSTRSVSLTVTAAENGLLLSRLTAAGDGWDFMPQPSPLPLPRAVLTAQGEYAPQWRLDSVTGDGAAVTARYTDAAGLSAVWRLSADTEKEGPVVAALTLENRTGETLTVRYRDMVSARFAFAVDDEARLYNFTRSKLFGFSRFPGEPLAETGVLEHWFAHNTAFSHNVCNEYANDIPTNYPMLPFEVIRSAAGRGVYIGHEFAFGRFMDLCEDDPRQITHETYLWDAGRLTVPDGEPLAFPAAYLGAFVGDLDTAGNQFKRWFWHKLPRSVRENPAEPLTQVDLPQREDELREFLTLFPLKQMGFEIGKIDISWLDGTCPLIENWPDSDMEKITHWNPDPLKWPHGMTAGRILAENGLRFSLWMSDTYRRVHIGTKEGREEEKQALLSRSLDYGFDTWRSDFELENEPFDYRNHEGLLEILDYMIANRPNFRYEHCAGAAALKDFSTLQRINVFTSEDGTTALRHRRTFYTNSYMIPPVQIKADIVPQCKMPPDDSAGVTEFFRNTPYIRYALRSGFLGAIQSSMPMEMYLGLGPIDRARRETLPYYLELVRHLALYRERMRPILRQGDVYHVLPMANGVDWDGFFFYNPAIARGALLVFKPSVRAEGGDNRRIALPGLEPDGMFTCTFEDRTEQTVTALGSELNEGLWVRGLSGDHASEIVWVDRI